MNTKTERNSSILFGREFYRKHRKLIDEYFKSTCLGYKWIKPVKPQWRKDFNGNYCKISYDGSFLFEPKHDLFKSLGKANDWDAFDFNTVAKKILGNWNVLMPLTYTAKSNHLFHELIKALNDENWSLSITLYDKQNDTNYNFILFPKNHLNNFRFAPDMITDFDRETVYNASNDLFYICYGNVTRPFSEKKETLL